jgi:exportin-T
VSLEVVNNAVQQQRLNTQSLQHLKENLLEYVLRVYGGSSQGDIDSPAIQNKLTQTLTFLFIFSYQNDWNSFLTDFRTLTTPQDNLMGTILYLRILQSIHDEIADVSFSFCF